MVLTHIVTSPILVMLINSGDDNEESYIQYSYVCATINAHDTKLYWSIPSSSIDHAT